MKSYKPFLAILLIPVLMVSFFTSTRNGLAQTGGEWSEPINLSNSGASKDPAMVVGTDGVIHVIWIDEFDGYKYVQSADGVDWTSPVTVRFPFLQTHSLPTFRVTENGVIHVFWLNDKNILNYAQTLQRNFGNPASWRATVRVGESVASYDVVVDDKDGLHISYISNDSLTDDVAGVYYRGSTNGGFSWTNALALFKSPYFRSLTPEDAHVRIAVPQDVDLENVYVVWDNPILKNILMSRSTDLGKSWESPFEVVGPEEEVGLEDPSNVEIDTMENGILLTWSVGNTGARCSSYSRWSDDGGDTWARAVPVLDDFSACPDQIGHINVGNDYFLVLLNVQEKLAMIAWDGTKWSNLQIQSTLSSLLDPLTSASLDLDVQGVFVQDETLFVVGSDRGVRNDIWFMSRTLGSLRDWFPLPSSWGAPQAIEGLQYQISSFSSMAGTDQKIHVVWTRTNLFDDDAEHAIYYAQWAGGEWTRPFQIIVDLNGLPDQVSLTADKQGRLILVWVDEVNGSLLFSWANSNRANIPLEWAPPVNLPSPSSLVSSPDVLVDDSGSIVVSYAVPLNEGRGIYIVRSDDGGETWSMPFPVVDAAVKDWDSVDQPRVALTGDGRLYALYSRYSIQDGIQPVGLYYSQSVDGGGSWDEGFMLSDKAVSWSDVVALGDLSVHFLWQEKNREQTTLHHRFADSNDSDLSSSQVILSSTAVDVLTSLAVDRTGQLHLLQLSSDPGLDLREWVWNGSLWTILETANLNFETDAVIPRTFSVGVTSDDHLVAVSVVEVDHDNGMEDRIVSVERILELLSEEQTPAAGVLPPQSITTSALPAESATEMPLSLSEIDAPQSALYRNIVGFLLIGAALVVTFIILKPKRK